MTNKTEYTLEGAENVILAPVKGKDSRRSLPKDFFDKNGPLFLLKFFFAFGLIAASWYTIYSGFSVVASVVAAIVAGLIYAHLIELQHECLHHHAFKAGAPNRLFGVLSGIFMFSAHSHYRYDHLRHHAYLGTPKNKEHFEYRFQDLNSVSGFLAAFFDLTRFKKVFNIMIDTLTFRPLREVKNRKYHKHIKQEYFFYLVLFIASVIYTVQTGDLFFLYAWWLPTLIVSEGAHFMIEFPEHFGLNTQTNPDVLVNTRTIYTNPIAQWYVNGNNLHTAHHYHQGVPMCNIVKLHKTIEKDIYCVNNSYMGFYRDVIKGNLQHDALETCMER